MQIFNSDRVKIISRSLEIAQITCFKTQDGWTLALMATCQSRLIMSPVPSISRKNSQIEQALDILFYSESNL